MRDGQGSEKTSDYYEETSAEFVSPYDLLKREPYPEEIDATESRGKLIGYGALFLGILSFFVFPVILGVVALIMGFIALRQGEMTIGSWAISISTLSLLISLFILPFF